jgi:hypothetical protein
MPETSPRFFHSDRVGWLEQLKGQVQTQRVANLKPSQTLNDV